MGAVTALVRPVTVHTVDGIAEVLRPGEEIDEERLAPFVRADLADPDSYTSTLIAPVAKKAPAGKKKKGEEPKAEAPEAEVPAAPAGEPGTDQEAEAPGEPGDAEKADGGQPDAEPKQEAPKAPRRSRQA